MKDVKWLLKRYGSFIVLTAVIIITGSIALGKRDTERNTEEVRESPVVIENTETVKEDESVECFEEESPNPAEALTGEKPEPVSILTAEEEQDLQDEAISAARQCMDLYKEIEIVYPETAYSYMKSFSEKQREDVVKRLGEQGFVSVSDDINMENYQNMEEFYAAYISGRDAMVTVFDVHREGNISARTFIHRNGKIQSFYVTVGWREGGIPEVKGFGSNDPEEIRLTEKGYFIYTNTEVAAHGNLREYYRVKPLSDECRELTKKYIYGLSYVNYNMLVTNWDADNVEEILMPRMFEDIYWVYTNEPFRAEGGLIPAEIYERVMTTCFPVSVEQVREYCGYHADADGYEYEMICARQFPPFGEVVDYKYNEDGTITLYVDGVWIDYNSDYAFTNQIVIRPFPDGTFRYLSNTIEQKELEVPQIGKERESQYIVPEWEDAYKEIVRSMESYLTDPYVLRKELKQVNSDSCIGYIGIHDFDDDGVPELIIGDGISIGIFTYDNGRVKRIADLYEPEDWGGINGVHYRENTIILVNNGSDGSCYVCLSCYDGEYVTGIYDEYNPQTAIVNGKEVTEEEFQKQFNIAGLSGDNSIPRSRMKKEDGIVTTLVIDAIRQEDEYTLIEDLDFGAIKW